MNPLYMEDAYMKEFEATVESVQKGGENKYFVVLDNTAFYPNGGGQLYDTGRLIKDGVEYPVVFVGKFGGKISHEVSKEGLKVGDRVKGFIDWERRYQLMRSHTAAHVMSAVFHKDAGALITGNQLEIEKIRIDFSLDDFDREKIMEYIKKANEIIARDLPTRAYFITREEAGNDPSLFKLAKGFPPEIKTIRIVEIEGFDRQADGGTHVKRLGEIGRIEFLKAENKGKNNRRVYFRLA